MMVVHIPLINFTNENGSTEVWPGTHLVTDHAETYRPEDGGITGQLEERGLTMPSRRANMPANSTLIQNIHL